MTTLNYAQIRGIIGVLDNNGEGLAHDANQPMRTVVLPLTRIIRKLEGHAEDFRQAVQMLVERALGGQPESQEDLKELEENQGFQKEYRDLLMEEVEVDIQKIDPEEIVGVSAATLLSIAPILEQE